MNLPTRPGGGVFRETCDGGGWRGPLNRNAGPVLPPPIESSIQHTRSIFADTTLCLCCVRLRVHRGRYSTVPATWGLGVELVDDILWFML